MLVVRWCCCDVVVVVVVVAMDQCEAHLASLGFRV